MKLCTRVVLISYVLFMLKPVMPVIADGLAHAFWANAHFATVHMHNGQKHVHYELRKAAREEGQEKQRGKIKWETAHTQHLTPVAAAYSCMPLCYLDKQAFLPYTCRYPAACLVQDYPPPKGVRHL